MGGCRKGGNSIWYCVNGMPQKDTLGRAAYTCILVSYRRLSPQFQFSLSGVTLVYLSQWSRSWETSGRNLKGKDRGGGGEGCAWCTSDNSIQHTATPDSYFSAFLLAPFPVFLSAVYPAGVRYKTRIRYAEQFACIFSFFSLSIRWNATYCSPFSCDGEMELEVDCGDSQKRGPPPAYLLYNL